jgi:signal transduction histidine kinase
MSLLLQRWGLDRYVVKLLGFLLLCPCAVVASPVVYQAKPTGIVISSMQSMVAPENTAAPLVPPDLPDEAWVTVDLPDQWSRSHPRYGGYVWYRGLVNFEKQPQIPWGLYLPRVIMNADVWVNGVLVGRDGRMDGDLTRHWNTPLLFSTPGSSWQAGLNIVHIRVAAYADNAGGLSEVHLGRFDLLAAKHATQRFLQNDLIYASNIGSIALGLFVFAIWVRRRDRVDYGYFSLGSMLWGIANFNFTIKQAPVTNAIWEFLVFVCMTWALLLLCLFTLRFANKAPRWLERSILIYALLYTLALAVSGPDSAVLWGKYGLLPVLLMGAWAMWQGAMFVRRVRTVDYKILGAVEALTLVLGFYDWLIQTGYMPFTSVYGLPFVAPLLLAALGWLIAGDYARTYRELSVLNKELESRITEKETALRQSFEKVAELERQRAVHQERTRIMRDMHDGVGMYLSSALRQLQSGSTQNRLIEQTLRDSLDHLKLTVDAMNFRKGDIGALLGSMRYRLTPRLEAVGLALNWKVDDLPYWSAGDVDHLRHLQHIIFEILSNVLQHSQATQVGLSATHEDTEIVIRIADNGLGFAEDFLPHGKGIQGVLQRAQIMGATVQWTARLPHGCEVTLRLTL